MSLKHALLGLLVRKPMTGYELERWIHMSIAHFWPAQLSQVYRTLRGLEDDGLLLSEVEPQESRPDRRVYTATARARQELASWLDHLVTEKDTIRVPFLVRFFFSGDRSVDDLVSQLRVLRKVYATERNLHESLYADNLTEAIHYVPHTKLDVLLWEQTQRAGQLYAEMWIAWIDETLARLAGFAQSPQPSRAQSAAPAPGASGPPGGPQKPERGR